ncbi:MAG: IclR family transcriptional regulator [Dethiobacter sp.]|nr:IclR family transcriptional regulator [Dethiobacter sp.]
MRCKVITGENGTKTVLVALSLLDYYTIDRMQIGLSEFVRLSGIPKANVLRHLCALEEKGFIKQDSKTKKYQLGFKALELAYLINKQFRIRDMVLPYMEKLRDETNETVTLQIEDRGRGICIERLDPNNALVYLTPMGSREYLHTGASRKVLLAYLPDDRIDLIIAEGLPRVTNKSVTDAEQLRREIALIRENGYSITEGEHVEGAFAVSAPIRVRDGSAIASLSVVGPQFRINKDKRKRYINLLLEMVKEISAELGFRE